MTVITDLPFDLPPHVEDLRGELREWLAAEGPPALRGVTVPRRPVGELEMELRRWADTLAGARLMCVSWPQAFGGRDLSEIEVAVMNQEFRRARLPRLTRGMGETLVGPSIIVHGTVEQKKRFLPRVIDGTDRYCQGFSEPGSGSDLASLTTTGHVDGDELVVSGHKIWTSWYWDATTMFCLCRTDPDAGRHHGLSYVLIPIERNGRRNGVEFTPLRQITGDAHFAETFLTEARSPIFNVIGGLNEGWRVAMTTLGNERGGSAVTRYLSLESEFWELVDEARSRHKLEDPVIRQRLARAYTTIHLLRFQALERLAAGLAGRPDRAPAAASLHKAQWSEHQRRFGELALSILGPAAAATGDTERLGPWQQLFFTARSHTIWGGTAEIQRNIIAERGLGLPKDDIRKKEQT